MATKASKEKVEKPKIPTINWTPTLVWKLISAAQSDENKNIMVGKAKEDVCSIFVG